jgi:hypothetical protein
MSSLLCESFGMALKTSCSPSSKRPIDLGVRDSKCRRHAPPTIPIRRFLIADDQIDVKETQERHFPCLSTFPLLLMSSNSVAFLGTWVGILIYFHTLIILELCVLQAHRTNSQRLLTTWSSSCRSRTSDASIRRPSHAWSFQLSTYSTSFFPKRH